MSAEQTYDVLRQRMRELRQPVLGQWNVPGQRGRAKGQLSKEDMVSIIERQEKEMKLLEASKGDAKKSVGTVQSAHICIF